ncbi:hypothetical protein [Streptomyces sp. NPDC002328]|uniref:hypothetical protein n=1 Tax=Streptomyces sp. NPDC002328 TaxID=3364642 RepID=UPI00368646F5
MSDAGRRYAKWAGDVVAAVTLLVCEAVGLSAAILVSLLLTHGKLWVTPVCLGGLAGCAGIIAAGAWVVHLRVTATVQGLVAGCCLVTVLIGLGGGFA